MWHKKGGKTSMRKFKSTEAISGREGIAYAKINGNNEELFFAKTIEATVEYAKSEVKSIGRRMAGHKVMGMSGSGSMTLHYFTPLFRSLLTSLWLLPSRLFRSVRRT